MGAIESQNWLLVFLTGVFFPFIPIWVDKKKCGSEWFSSTFVSFLSIKTTKHRKYHIFLPFPFSSLQFYHIQIDDAKKSLLSHTVFVHSKQYLHNKERRPNREHRYDVSQIPSESQVRTFHHSRVPELG